MPKDVIECERCNYQWASDAVGPKVTCASCGYKTERNVVGKEILMRGKFLYLESEDIDDMISATETRLETLRDLKGDGYEVSDPTALKDDYCYLQKDSSDDSGTSE